MTSIMTALNQAVSAPDYDGAMATMVAWWHDHVFGGHDKALKADATRRCRDVVDLLSKVYGQPDDAPAALYKYLRDDAPDNLLSARLLAIRDRVPGPTGKAPSLLLLDYLALRDIRAVHRAIRSRN